MIHDGSTTSEGLLERVQDWRDRSAWRELFQKYDPLIVRWCRELSLDVAAADEVRQRVWVELANRLRTFRYDPRRTFRGWLRQFCRSRCIDFLRQRKRDEQRFQDIDLHESGGATDAADPFDLDTDDSDESDTFADELLREVAAAQEAVQRRVSDRTWDVFWQIGILGRAIKEVAAEHGMSYAAAYEAYHRVARMLRREGKRRRGDSGESDGTERK